MPLPTVSTPGTKLARSRWNALINFVNSLETLINSAATSNKSFVTFTVSGGVVTIVKKTGNISTVTRVGAGAYKINFTTPIEDKAYSCVASCSQTDGNDTGFAVISDKQEGYQQFTTRNDDGDAADITLMDVILTY